MKNSENRFKIIYGKYDGVEKKAVELMQEAVSEHIIYSIPTLCADFVTDEDLKDGSLIIVGTAQSNKLLKKLEDEKVYNPADKAEGYSIKVMQSIYNPDAQMIIVSGFDEHGALYGAVDFRAYYTPYAENTHIQGVFFRPIFNDAPMPEYETVSAPQIKHRGLWTWGHVIYDYQAYIQNMVRLKMNTLIVWNDFVPVNIKDVIDMAHEYGIYIYLGFSWGWNEARPDCECRIDISDDAVIEQLSNTVVYNYEKNYSHLDIDGIYFQSFTEIKAETRNGKMIAECVVDLVNKTADKLFKQRNDLALLFGLHASSVHEKLEYIKQTDERISIIWEDCGAFPYAYMPHEIIDFEETCEFTKKIASLRGKNENFGVVTKGLICLNWFAFEHQKAPYIMGKYSKEYIQKRTDDRKKFWKYLQSYWLKNAHYAYDMVKLINESNENSMVTALVEDGMFENAIYPPVALYGEMLWDCKSDLADLWTKITLRPDVEF